MAWGTVESNRFGTHEFLKYAEHAAVPNLTSARTSAPAPGTKRSSGWSTATPSEDTAMTRLRKQNGRAAAVESDVLGTGQRDGRPVADGPPQRGRLRQVRARSGQADEVTDPEHQADRGRLVQLRRRRPIGPAGIAPCSIPRGHADYLSLHMYVGNRAKRLRRIPGQFRGAERAHQDRRGHYSTPRFPASRATGKFTSPGTSGTSGTAPAATVNAAAGSWRSATTWKTRWWWRRS